MTTIWDWRAPLYDVCEGSDVRRGPHKDALFSEMRGHVLFVAVGTGIDIRHFPPDLQITAIDISTEMLRRAARRAAGYRGALTLMQEDVMNLRFPDDCFDTVVTSCTMCSVPDPLAALRELHRVLRPGGRLLMFEHVRSRNPLFAWMLDLMTLWSRWGGTEMNRDTVRTVQESGFAITGVQSIFLDIILAIRGMKPVIAH